MTRERIHDTQPMMLSPAERRDARDDEHSSGSRPNDTQPAAAPNTTGGEAALPPAPYDPPVMNEQLRGLLDGLNPSRAPRPIDLPQTDGDLAAKYSAGPREPAPRNPTPTPQAKLLLNCTEELPPIAREERSPEPGSGVASPIVIPIRQPEPTLRLPRRTEETPAGLPSANRGRLQIALVACAALIVIAVVAFFATTERSPSESPASATSVRRDSVPPAMSATSPYTNVPLPTTPSIATPAASPSATSAPAPTASERPTFPKKAPAATSAPREKPKPPSDMEREDLF